MRKVTRYDAVISGYYGFGNMGDDAVLSVLTEKLRERNPEARIAVISKNKSDSEKKYGVSCIGRFDLWGIVRAMIGAKMLIMGGGSLLQNETSRRSLLYYTFIVKLGHFLCKNVFVYANGIGALKGKSGYRRARRALLSADRVSVRDPDSFGIARSLSKDAKRTVLSADPVFLMSLPSDGAARLKLEEAGLSGKRFFAVSLRVTRDEKELPFSEIVDFCKKYSRRGLLPLFLPMQDEYDGELCRRAAEECGGRVLFCDDARTVGAILGKAEFSVGMRLHFLLLSLMGGTPTVALSYDCKIDSSVPYAGGKHVIPAESATASSIEFQVKAAQKDTDAEKLRHRCLEMRSLALWDINYLCSVLYEKEELHGREKRPAHIIPW